MITGLDFPYHLAPGDTLKITVGKIWIEIEASKSMTVSDFRQVLDLAMKIAHGMYPGRVERLDLWLALKEIFGEEK